jgi:hypothetical protein
LLIHYYDYIISSCINGKVLTGTGLEVKVKIWDDEME